MFAAGQQHTFESICLAQPTAHKACANKQERFSFKGMENVCFREHRVWGWWWRSGSGRAPVKSLSTAIVAKFSVHATPRARTLFGRFEPEIN